MRSLLITVVAVACLLGAATTQAADCPLTGIPPTVYQQDQTYGTIHGTYDFFLSACGAQTPPSSVPACSGGPSSGYFAQFDVGGSCQFMLDQIGATGWTYASGSTDSYSADFSSSQGSNTAQVTILCDANAGGVLVGDGDVIATARASTGYNYATLLKSNACPVATSAAPSTTPLPSGQTFAPTTSSAPNTTAAPPTPVPNGTNTEPDEDVDSGCGGGCIFLLLLTVGATVYGVGAVAWNFRIGKRGKELAPHPGFWMEFISLVKEGCVFVAQGVCGLVDKCRGKSGGGGGGEGYSSV